MLGCVVEPWCELEDEGTHRPTHRHTYTGLSVYSLTEDQRSSVIPSVKRH